MTADLKTTRYALIQLDNEGYALELTYVSEIVEKPTYEKWTGEGEVVGFFKYAKKRLPVYRLAPMLGLDAESNFLIVVKYPNSPYCLLVPERPSFADLTREDILPLPDLLPERGKHILSGVVVANKGIYGLLDPKGLTSE